MKKRVKLTALLFATALILSACTDKADISSDITESTENAVATESVDETDEVSENATIEAEDSDAVEDTAAIVSQMDYSCATKEEGIDYLMSNTEYYEGFTQNDLDYKMQKKGAELDEYLEFSREQVLDFTDEDLKLINESMADIEQILSEKEYTLPELDPIVFIKTTQDEECGSAAYTHGTQIYLGEYCFTIAKQSEEGKIWFETVLAHEIFHCLTRSNPDFRKEMYKLINFEVQDEDFEIPPSVEEYFINNPDVEHHNSYGTFVINGEEVDCFAVLVTTEHFEKEGDSFFDCMTTGLVPVDGSDMYYVPDDASNFYEVFGENTGYVIDPEECMADNFSYAVIYGPEGPGGNGYPTQDIIDGIVDYLENEK